MVIHVALDEVDISPAAFRVYFRLARMSGAKGQAWPKLSTLAASIGMNIKTVSAAMKVLEECEMIASRRRFGQSSVYVLTAPGAWKAPLFQKADASKKRINITPETGTESPQKAGEEKGAKEERNKVRKDPEPAPVAPADVPAGKIPDAKTKAPPAPPAGVTMPILFSTPEFAAAWDGFVEMRKKKRAPLTTRATQIIIAKLEKWSGNDVAKAIDILDASTVGNWTDIYDPAEKQAWRAARQPRAAAMPIPASHSFENLPDILPRAKAS